MASERGMTLIEAIVALFLAALLFAALSAAVIGAIRASQVARQNQTAVDIANARVEQLRDLAWGELGHDADGIDCPDSNLTDCTTAPKLDGRPLVSVDFGGIAAQRDTEVVNVTTYEVATYITEPPAGSTGDYRLATVIVYWDDFGTPRSKRVDTAISESTRGLALPDFVLSSIGNCGVAVNPGATAYWGFKVTNEGAPDTFNISTTGDFTPSRYYLDDGDSEFDPAVDTQLADTTGDTKVDTGRLDPLDSAVVWVVYDVPEAQADGTLTLSITVTSASQPLAETATNVLVPVRTLVVQSGVITQPPIPCESGTSTPTPTPTGDNDPTVCADTAPAPDPSEASGYTRYSFWLHNSGSTSWPATPLPETGEIPGTVAFKPMVMNTTLPAIPTGRLLPPYSTDLQTVDPTRGRLLFNGGGFTYGKEYVADFQSPSKAKRYTSAIVLRTYVKRAPGSGAESVSLEARPYAYKSNGNHTTQLLSPVTVTVNPWSCDGWQAVSFSFPITSSIKLSNHYAMSVRIWNSGTGWVRIAYDHADFPSSLTVVEK
ncbi:MAG: prepilin-type N-terminal cleavage/methylation domain-containing protein [Candidatus Nanopelagicales bacterium]|nr:prepilin-type N-terminal cleavage/methylation domain-containing protein [Candidatus Nanopelagicales bacterium]